MVAKIVINIYIVNTVSGHFIFISTYKITLFPMKVRTIDSTCSSVLNISCCGHNMCRMYILSESGVF